MSVMQHKYIIDINIDARMTTAKLVLIPLPQGLNLSAEHGALLKEPKRYRRLIGCLFYLGFTRPRLSFAVQQLSQFLQNPTNQHGDVALHIVCYLKGTTGTGLFFFHLLAI
ncbi:UNVERIFIED_CONTAM: hypothetical protein Slati_3956100 [Sesamum latifolium]|uniref:Reverse transcriptase n=1 Tax=Sesamum latifolium TaxID=2727402 RepID=A0AAW2TPC0_9LAMI